MPIARTATTARNDQLDWMTLSAFAERARERGLELGRFINGIAVRDEMMLGVTLIDRSGHGPDMFRLLCPIADGTTYASEHEPTLGRLQVDTDNSYVYFHHAMVFGGNPMEMIAALEEARTLLAEAAETVSRLIGVRRSEVHGQLLDGVEWM